MIQVTETPSFILFNIPMSEKRLIMFYEEQCAPCVAMEPLINELEKNLGIKIEKLEAMSNEKNRQLLEKYAGVSMVPFFYNEDTGAKISGEADYNSLKKWAQGKND